MAKKEDTKRLVLLDAHAILHRAYHALPDFTSHKGEPTGALYGLAAMLLRIIGDLKPDYIAACYDLPEKTYRHEVYEDYKAGRAKADDELVSQMNRSRDIFTALSIPIYEKGGFEADDVLGTIVEQVTDSDIEIVIASGDMDTLQLVDNKRVQVYTLKKGIKDTIMYDEKGVEDRFGFKPKYLPDFKGLRGDPSDNIIGISGIGEKTATELIKAFKTIEGMYKVLKKNPERFAEVGIKPRIQKLLEENEEEALFSKMLASIRRDVPITYELPKSAWIEHVEPEKVYALFEELGFRTLSQRAKELFARQGFVTEEDETPAEEVSERDVQEVGIALWLLRSDITNPSLDDILSYAKTESFKEAREKIFSVLKKEKLDTVYERIEKPLIPIVKDMEERGIAVDAEYLGTLSKEYHKSLAKLERSIWDDAGTEFNINSPRQLGEILFDKLEIKIKNHKRTGTGQKSTRESELEKMRDAHPIIEKILSHRELQKLLSTYIDNIPKMLDANGRLHTHLLQTGTTTGRMSSQNPNLQNIPIRTELGRAIRNAFVASEGFALAAFDYSQIELRVAAFLSEDEKLMQIFKDKTDAHTAVAAEVFDVPPEQVDSEMRRSAKVINFGILYGMGVSALQQNLGTSRAEAQKFYDAYFTRFSGLARYLENMKRFAARTGYTETFFGRRRYFEGITSSLPYVRAQAERMAINAPIQGTEADIIKLAMIAVRECIAKEGWSEQVYMLLQVHDELIFEIAEDAAEEIAPRIKEAMESVMSLEETKGVPIETGFALGPSWGELEK